MSQRGARTSNADCTYNPLPHSYADVVAVSDVGATPGRIGLPLRHSECLPTVALEGWKRGRVHQHGQTTSRQLRILTLGTRIGAALRVLFGAQQLVIIQSAQWIGVLHLTAAVVFLAIPKLYRFGELLGPLVF